MESRERTHRCPGPDATARVPADGRSRPRRHGRAPGRRRFGLWLVTLRATGEFVGDCGLTPQEVEGTVDIEVGYHVRAELQGRGYATEAAAACRDHARDILAAKRLIAIIHPDNTPSQRVAEKTGLSHERDAVSRAGDPVRVYAATL